MKSNFKLFAVLMVPGWLVLSAGAYEPVNEPLPMTGTGGHGHCYPGATVPFGMVQLSPDTPIAGWDGCAGYHYSDTVIYGFSHTHLTGTGGACLGDILLMPTVGRERLEADPPGQGYSSRFSHAQEQARPGDYRVLLLDQKVAVELTATARCGFHRYTFPAAENAHVVLDLLHGIQNDTTETSMDVESHTTVSGSRSSDGWGGDRAIYFVMEFSKPFDSFGLEDSGKRLQPDVSKAAGKLKAIFNFKTAAKEAVLVKVGISGTSIEGARRNLAAEIPGWDFDGVRKAAVKQWKQVFDEVKITSADPHVRSTFYANLYLTCLAPTLFNDVDGTYRGMDHQNHAADFQNYTELSLWDTYRAEHPLLTLLQPDRVADLVKAMLAEYRENGQHTVPIWPLWGNETWCMIGYHSAAVIAEAYCKGFRNFDAEAAYQAMRDTAMQDRNGLKSFKELGYMVSAGGQQAVSRTLEYSFDDWCIARMAEALGHKADAQLFYKRSANYRNLFDGSTRFFRGRRADGNWRRFLATGLINDDYTESDAWQYAFGAQHDVPGMIQLYGGDNGFIQKLDDLFSADSVFSVTIPDITGIIGQYAQGNEPAHHIAYLYNYAGAPYKTQQHVRQIMSTLYDETPSGLCGNGDCGQMSAWYVFSALGFYPVNPASGIYMIGSPAVNQAVLQLNGKNHKGATFTIEAENNGPENVYIQSASLNGRALDRAWLSHDEITAGGTLRLVMGSRPNTNWGSAPANRPPATMPANFQYGPLPAPAVASASKLKATASNVYQNQDFDYGAQCAFDEDPETRWATDQTPSWIAADLGEPRAVHGVRIEEAISNRVQEFEFQYRDGAQWKTLFTGTKLGPAFEQKFAPVTAQEFRLNILRGSENATITEIKFEF